MASGNYSTAGMGMATGYDAPKNVDESKVDALLSTLDRELSELRDLAGNLGVRLHAVRTPGDRCETQNAPPESVVCPLANRIRGAGYLVASTRSELMAILETIEV